MRNRFHIVVIWIFLCLSANLSFAQEKDVTISRQIFAAADEMPSYPGGTPALRKFIHKHIRFPESAIQKNIDGKVTARFVVEPDGRLSNIEIIGKLDPDCDREALRLIALMPRWDPGIHNGVPVAVYYVLPLSFRLHD